MKLSVREAFASYTYYKEYEYTLTKEQLEDFPAGAECDEVYAKVTVSSESGVVTCKINVRAEFETFCSRCLEPLKLPFDVTSEKIVRREENEDFEDVIYTDGSLCIDVVEEIRMLIYFEFPTKPLCSEDCKGLCPVCGCNLNTASCSCDIRTVDPRLAVLKNLIDK